MYLFSSKTFGPPLGPTQPPVEWVLGTFTLGVKRPEREAEHLPQPNGEVKNKWRSTSTPSVCLYSARGQFQLFIFTTAHPLTYGKLDESTQFSILKSYFIVIFPSTPRSSKWWFSFRFPYQKFVFTSPLPTNSPHALLFLSILDLISRIRSGQYRSCRSSCKCDLHYVKWPDYRSCWRFGSVAGISSDGSSTVCAVNRGLPC